MLGPTIGDYLGFMRDGAESKQTDSCTITRASDQPPVFDQATGTTTEAPRVPVYAGQCEISADTSTASTTTAGEHEFTVQALQVAIPISGVVVRVDDVVRITDSMFDPGLVGRVFVVGGVEQGSHMTARRFTVTEVTS